MRNVRLLSNGLVNKTNYAKSIGMPQCLFFLLALLAILHVNIILPKYL
jgi:hypothetical protein